MNKSEYLMTVYDTLNDLPSDVRTAIVSEYREYFNSELEKGKTEEEIIMSLGDPITLAYAAKQRRGYGQDNHKDFKMPRRRRRSSGSKIGVILLLLGVFTIMGTSFSSQFFKGMNKLNFGIPNKTDIDDYKEVNLGSVKNIIVNTTSSDTYIETTSSDKVTSHLKGDVRTSDQDSIPYLSMETSGDTLLIEVKRKQNHVFFYSSNIDFYVSIPEKYDGNIEYVSSSGNLEISDATLDNLTIKLTSGDINIQDIDLKNKFDLSSTSGNSNISKLNANSMSYQSTSGDRNFRNITIKEDIDINSTSGRTQLYDITCNQLSIDSTSGDINIGDTKLDLLIIGSRSGTINVEDLDGGTQIETTSGYTKLSFSNAQENIYVKSLSGNVDIILPDNLGFTLNSKTTSGDIDCEFSLTNMKTGKHSLSGVYGNGEVDISISVTSGDINIKED